VFWLCEFSFEFFFWDLGLDSGDFFDYFFWEVDADEGSGFFH